MSKLVNPMYIYTRNSTVAERTRDVLLRVVKNLLRSLKVIRNYTVE